MFLNLTNRKYLVSIKQMPKQAFTLIELIVVIAIVGILSAVIAPSAFEQIEKAKVQKIVKDFKVIKSGIITYYSDTGDWGEFVSNQPESENQNPIPWASCFLSKDNGKPGWDGPYISKPPKYENLLYYHNSSPGWVYTDKYSEARILCIANVSLKFKNKIDNILDDGSLTTGMMKSSESELVNLLTFLVSGDSR